MVEVQGRDGDDQIDQNFKQEWLEKNKSKINVTWNFYILLLVCNEKHKYSCL